MPKFNEIFDSFEEFLFAEWLDEAIQYGFVSRYQVHPKSFPLTRKHFLRTVNGKKKTIREHSYKPDFIVFPTQRFTELNLGWILAMEFIEIELNCFYIDIKGAWASETKKQEFSINRKLVLDKHGIYVNRVTVDDRRYRSQGIIKTTPGLFSLTWAPARAFLGPKGRPSTKYQKCNTIREFLRRKR